MAEEFGSLQHLAKQAYLLRHTKKWHYGIYMAYIWHNGKEALRSFSLPLLLIVPPYEQYTRQQSFCEAKASCLVEDNVLRTSISCKLVLIFSKCGFAVVYCS